jgi:hypothetical protein
MMRKGTYLSYNFLKSWVRIYDIAQPHVLATEYLKMGSKRFGMVWSCDQVILGPDIKRMDWLVIICRKLHHLTSLS